LSVNFHKEEVKISIDETLISSWVQKSVKTLEPSLGEICIVFCDDEYLKKINVKHLNHDYYTDIITFDYSKDNEISGDLFISIDRVKENAKTNNVEFMNELCRVIIHGVLHLCGFNDKTTEEKTEIRQKENFFLSLLF
jgi:rRNA maturation RNase YbeY